MRDFCDLVVLINKTVLAFGETAKVFTPENLALAFGGLPADLLVVSNGVDGETGS